MARIPPGDRRTERYRIENLFQRLQYDLDGYFTQGVRAGKEAHTNEFIYADAIEALLNLEERVRKLEIAIKGMGALDLAALEKRLKRVEGRVTAFIVETQ